MSACPRIQISTAFCCLMAATPVFAATSPGLGEPWPVDTSIPAALQTLSIEIPSTTTRNGKFEYEIGFGTSEQPSIGSLFDSLTIALSRADGSQSANLVTADVFGLTVVPISQGSLLANGSVSVTQIPHDATTLRDSPTMFAYAITVGLPPELVGENLRTTFGFFNNGDAVPSGGHASVVPEPKAALLALAGLAVFVLKALRRARKS